jgi:hypothetical protein
MPQDKIDFAPKQESTSDELGGASPSAFNIVVDGRGGVRRRPGLATWDEAPTTAVDSNGIAGLYATSTSEVYAVGDHPNVKPIYKVSGGSSLELGYAVPGTNRPVFAETEALLVVAAGRAPTKVELDTATASALGGSPPECTHVISNALRLLANDTTDQTMIRFTTASVGGASDFSANEEWTLGTGDAGFFYADARPDPIQALHENTNEVYAFGTNTMQVFAPENGATTYQTVSTRELGCSAPYAVIKDDQSFVWIDDKRRIVRTDGRLFNVISDPIKSTLDSLTTVEDAYGYRVVMGYVDVLVFAFPSDGITLAFNRSSGWSQWSAWDDEAGTWGTFNVLSHALVTDTNTNIVGTIDGKIAKFSFDASDDLGTPIVARSDTGFLDRGTDNRKHCRAIHMTFRRGEAATTGVHGLLQWRDDTGAWGTPLEVRLGDPGERFPVVSFRSLGVYRRRQWRFTFTSSEDLVLVSVREDFEILGM